MSDTTVVGTGIEEAIEEIEGAEEAAEGSGKLISAEVIYNDDGTPMRDEKGHIYFQLIATANVDLDPKYEKVEKKKNRDGTVTETLKALKQTTLGSGRPIGTSVANHLGLEVMFVARSFFVNPLLKTTKPLLTFGRR